MTPLSDGFLAAGRTEKNNFPGAVQKFSEFVNLLVTGMQSDTVPLCSATYRLVDHATLITP